MPAVSSLQRRRLLAAGGGLIACATLLPVVRAQERDVLEIDMAGTASGAHVWFKPRGLLVRVGQTVTWTNRDKGNVHTVTAYHEDNGKPTRMPAQATAWDSGYIMPGKSFSMTFTVAGVYDYYCIPHEQAGMVGRLVVGKVDPHSPYTESDDELAPAALNNLPDVSSIVQQRQVD